MKRFLFFAAALSLVCQSAFASPKADSIKAFTGASRCKFVWERRVMADANYNPVTPQGTRLMLFDTDEGVERALDSINGYLVFMRISRSGKWAMWNETNADGSAWVQKTGFISLVTPNAKKTYLLDKATCTYWCARAWWIDPAAGTEWVFCLNNYTSQGDAIYKIPVTATGTADLSRAAKVFAYSAGIDDALSISSDGVKLGSAFPWPDTKILDLTNGTLANRHNSSSAFGCQGNLAPDDSYRFFHCADDHRTIYMFGPKMSTDMWQVDLNRNLPVSETGFSTDFDSPRWSNHPQFFSNTFPLDRPDPSIYSSATAIKALRLSQGCCTFLSKFSPDFKSVEKSILIGGDVRYQECRADSWLSNGITDVNGTVTLVAGAPASTAGRSAGMRVRRSGSLIAVQLDRGAPAVVELTDALGTVLQHLPVAESATIETQGLAAGVYFLTVSQRGLHMTERVVVR